MVLNDPKSVDQNTQRERDPIKRMTKLLVVERLKMQQLLTVFVSKLSGNQNHFIVYVERIFIQTQAIWCLMYPQSKSGQCKYSGENLPNIRQTIVKFYFNSVESRQELQLNS